MVREWSWCGSFLRRDLLPDRRVVVRFAFAHRGRQVTIWLLAERGQAELCGFDPGFGEDLVVEISDPVLFARWHLGLVEWAVALRAGGISVRGPAPLRRALPTWDAGPLTHTRMRAEQERAPGSPPLPPPGAGADPAAGPGAPYLVADRGGPLTVHGFAGPVVTPDDPGYDEARAVWNGAVDRRPAALDCGEFATGPPPDGPRATVP